MTAAVYVDGFNLYYGVAKALNCRWVDLQTLFEAQFPNDDIRQIYFFEAIISGPHRVHQEAYVRAIDSLDKVQVVLGQMKDKPRTCKVDSCTFGGERMWMDHEEKHTDVSIAITMVDDAHRGGYDKLILVTGDTDLVPAVRMAKIIRPQLQITLCIPAMHKSRIFGARPIADLCDRTTRVDAELFVKSQFPRTFTDILGRRHSIPAHWRIAPKDAVRDWKRDHATDYLPNLPAWCH